MATMANVGGVGQQLLETVGVQAGTAPGGTGQGAGQANFATVLQQTSGETGEPLGLPGGASEASAKGELQGAAGADVKATPFGRSGSGLPGSSGLSTAQGTSQGVRWSQGNMLISALNVSAQDASVRSGRGLGETAPAATHAAQDVGVIAPPAIGSLVQGAEHGAATGAAGAAHVGVDHGEATLAEIALATQAEVGSVVRGGAQEVASVVPPKTTTNHVKAGGTSKAELVAKDDVTALNQGAAPAGLASAPTLPVAAAVAETPAGVSGGSASADAVPQVSVPVSGARLSLVNGAEVNSTAANNAVVSTSGSGAAGGPAEAIPATPLPDRAGAASVRSERVQALPVGQAAGPVVTDRVSLTLAAPFVAHSDGGATIQPTGPVSLKTQVADDLSGAPNWIKTAGAHAQLGSGSAEAPVGTVTTAEKATAIVVPVETAGPATGAAVTAAAAHQTVPPATGTGAVPVAEPRPVAKRDDGLKVAAVVPGVVGAGVAVVHGAGIVAPAAVPGAQPGSAAAASASHEASAATAVIASVAGLAGSAGSPAAPVVQGIPAAPAAQHTEGPVVLAGSEALSTAAAASVSSATVPGGLQHTTLSSTPTSLEVGVSSGTHGWLKIRAELNATGGVDASLTGTSAARLRSDLPALSSFLAQEKVALGSLNVGLAGAVHTMAGGASAGSSYSRSGGEAGTAAFAFGADAGASGGRAGQGGGQQQAGSSTGVAVASATQPVVAESGFTSSRLGYGEQVQGEGSDAFASGEYGSGGGWLNVRA